MKGLYSHNVSWIGGEQSQIVHFLAIADSTLKEYEIIVLKYYRKTYRLALSYFCAPKHISTIQIGQLIDLLKKKIVLMIYTYKLFKAFPPYFTGSDICLAFVNKAQ